MADLAYPFVPKSTRSLKRGQFWSLPLGNAGFGAACVVGSLLQQGKRSQRTFIAGVINWVGPTPPTAHELRGCQVVEFAFAHIKAITESGGCVLGEAEIQLDQAPQAAEALSLPTWGFHFPVGIALRLAQNAA
jgi:hypothetical protein